MPFGVRAHIGIGKETSYGTPVAATEYLRFASESINEEIEQVISENIMGIVDEAASHEGLHNISGDVSGDVYPNVVGHLLRAAFGAPVTTQPDAVNNPTVYQHVFTPVQDNFSNVCALPPYTLEIHRDFEQSFQYAGSVVNDLTFSFGTDTKIMQFAAAILARKLALITKTTPSLDAANPFMWNQATISIDGSGNTDLSTVEFGVNNNLEARATLDGTKEVSRVLRNGARTFPISFSMELKDLTEFNKYRAQNEIPAKIELTGEIISGNQNYKLTVDIPKLRYNAFPINVGGAGSITAQVQGSAKYDHTSLFGMKVTLVNSTASY